MAPLGVADHVVEILALDLASAEEQIVRRDADVEIYRLLAQSAIHRLHELTLQHDRLRDSHVRLINEYRTLREQTTLPAAAAA